MMTFETRLLASLAGQPIKQWAAMAKPHLFEDDPEAKKAFEFCDAFARANGVVPSAQTLQEHTGLVLPKDPGEAPWLVGKLVERRVRRRMALLSEELQELTKTDPLGALEVMRQRATTLSSEMRSVATSDFTQAITQLWPHLIEKWSGAKQAVPMPWETLDQQIGGLYGGEILSIIGRPGLGKSYVLLLMAHHVWRTLQRPVVVSTLEMKALKVMERLAAIHTRVPIDVMKDGVSVTFFGKGSSARAVLKAGLVSLEEKGMPPFLIVDGGLAAKPDQLVSVCRMESPAFVAADGPYLFKGPRPNMKQWERVEYAGEVLKQEIATDMDVPVGATWQFNREGAKEQKRKGGGKADLEHIAGGDTVGQISSVVIGLSGAPGDSKANVEMLQERQGELLKGRDGESGTWRFRWDFRKMDFGEVKTAAAYTDENGLPVMYGV